MWSVRFNHFHDQLVLTASSDSRVVLNSVPSLSSEPFGKLVDDLDDDDLDNDSNGDIESNAMRAGDSPSRLVQFMITHVYEQSINVECYSHVVYKN